MYIAYLTPWLNGNNDKSDRPAHRATARRLERRRGGGGKGGGKGGGGSSGGSGGGGGGSRSVPISNTGSSKGTATSYGNGGGKKSTLPAGSTFAGRSVGGGDRGQVYGSRTYGSGYPGVGTYGVAGRGFPFYFWPVAFGSAGVGGAYYYNHEYGSPNNDSRPGGPMTTLTFLSASPSSNSNSTFHVFADNTTSVSLLASIYDSCSSLFSPNPPSSANNSLPAAYNESDTSRPKPEQAVQYYRASSVALTLDGYNNTAALSDAVTSGNASAGSVADAPLPTNVDQTLLGCLNNTIGAGVPLIDGAPVRWSGASGLGGLSLAWVVWYLLGSLA